MKYHAIIHLDGANIAHGFANLFHIFQTKNKKIGVMCGAMRRVKPHAEQQRAFETICFTSGRNGKAIQKTFDGVAHKYMIEIFTAQFCAVEQSSMD